MGDDIMMVESVPNGTVVGRVTPVSWFVLDDGVYSFHAASLRNGTVRVFRSRNDTWPSVRAVAKGLGGVVFMRNATSPELNGWLTSHPERKLRRVVVV